MHFSRDYHIRMGVRQLNWLRFEHYKRVNYLYYRWKNLLLKCLICDSSLSLKKKVWVHQKLIFLPKKSRLTRHTTRCWFSGRSRQVQRNFLLARMHYRSALYDGSMPFLNTQRS